MPISAQLQNDNYKYQALQNNENYAFPVKLLHFYKFLCRYSTSLGNSHKVHAWYKLVNSNRNFNLSFLEFLSRN